MARAPTSIAGKCAALGLGAALGLCGVAHAQLFKCVDADGNTAFQAVPCPAAGKEQRLSVSPAAGPDPKSLAAKLGWDRGEIMYVADTCNMASFHEARREYDSHPHPVSEPFDEGPFAGSVTSHCGCLATRASTTWTYAEFSKNPLAAMSQLTTEALAGGLCKPTGRHAELLRKAGKMQ